MGIITYGGVATSPSTGAASGTGKDAYEIAVDLGFAGTRSEWIDSLRGEDLTTPDEVADVMAGAYAVNTATQPALFLNVTAPGEISFTNLTSGRSGYITFVQDATGHAVTFHADVAGTATVSATPGARTTVFYIITDGIVTLGTA